MDNARRGDVSSVIRLILVNWHSVLVWKNCAILASGLYNRYDDR